MLWLPIRPVAATAPVPSRAEGAMTTIQTSPQDRPAPSAPGAEENYVYFFGEGRADGNAGMRDLLGGKGAGLAEMTNAGVPVPPGFTITTDVCRWYDTHHVLPPGFEAQQVEALARLERVMGKRLGDASDPLLVAGRSGARVS